MKIDLSMLIKGLMALPHTTAEPADVSLYVLEHIFAPLKADGRVLLADLDFKAFTEEDLDDLRAALAAEEDRQERLERLCTVLHDAKPCAAVRRRFC